MSKFAFRLFIAGEESKYQITIHNFRQICDRYILGRYELTVIDVLSSPETADRERILVTPTLVRVSPGPACRVVGDLCCDERMLLTELGLTAAPSSGRTGIPQT